MSSVETTDKRLEVEVPSSAVMYMPGVSAGTSVCKVVVVPADNFPPTRRVEALSLSNGPTTSVSVTSLNLTFDEDTPFERGPAQWIYARTRLDNADGSFAVHPVISEKASWCILVFVLDQELHPNQIVYVLIGARVVLDSSGKLFVGLAGSDFNFAVAEQVIVPNDTMTFLASEASTTTTMVVSFAEPVQLPGINVSFRIALRVRAEVLCGKNTMIRKCLQMGHNDCPNAELDKSRADMKGNLDFIFATKCSLDDIREVLANNRRWQEARTGQISNVDVMLPSGLVGMDPSQTSFFQLLSIGTKMVGPGASEIVLGLGTVALVDGASVLIFSAIFQEVGTFHLVFDTDAFTLSSIGDVALISPAIFNVVALDSEEPIEDLLFPNVGSTSDVPSEIAFYVNERVGASTEGSKIIGITAGGVEVAIPSGQGDRVHVLAPGSSVSVDPPNDLTYGSEVSVIADDSAFMVMEGHEIGWRFGPPPTKMYMLASTDSALQNACRP